jgi:hypothetical protein
MTRGRGDSLPLGMLPPKQLIERLDNAAPKAERPRNKRFRARTGDFCPAKEPAT